MSTTPLQIARLLLVGALFSASVHFCHIVWKRRNDVLMKTAAAYHVFAFVGMAMRTAQHANISPLQATYGLKIFYTAQIAGAVSTALLLSPHGRRRTGLLLVYAALLTASFWIDGGMFASPVVERITTPGESYLSLSPGPFFYAALAAIGGLIAYVVGTGIRQTASTSEVRRVLLLVAPATCAAFGWDALMDAGIVTGRLAAGWCVGGALLVLGVVGLVRTRRAHGKLVGQLRAQRHELADQQHELTENEHLSALGASSDGLGHEINNPLATISLNVIWSRMRLQRSHYASTLIPLWNARMLVADLEEATRNFRTRFGPSSQRSKSTPPRHDASAPARPRLLVIDDDPLIRRALRRSLDMFVVTTAGGGAEALERLFSEPFDAVLCDVMMPGMTGLEVYQRVAAEYPELATRFVFLTGGAFGDDIALSVSKFPGPVLNKPVDAQEIASQLASQLATMMGAEDASGEVRLRVEGA